MQIGDLIRPVTGSTLASYFIGLVIEIDVNMRGEETVPTGIRVLWSGEEECVYEDEIEIVQKLARVNESAVVYNKHTNTTGNTQNDYLKH